MIQADSSKESVWFLTLDTILPQSVRGAHEAFCGTTFWEDSVAQGRGIAHGAMHDFYVSTYGAERAHVDEFACCMLLFSASENRLGAYFRGGAAASCGASRPPSGHGPPQGSRPCMPRHRKLGV